LLGFTSHYVRFLLSLTSVRLRSLASSFHICIVTHHAAPSTTWTLPPSAVDKYGARCNARSPTSCSSVMESQYITLHGKPIVQDSLSMILNQKRPLDHNGHKILPSCLLAWLRAHRLTWRCFCPVDGGEEVPLCAFTNLPNGTVLAHCQQAQSCRFESKFTHCSGICNH
jgi:hypothetical protein